MFKTEAYKEAFGHMLTNKMTDKDYSILNLAKEPYPAMPQMDSKLDGTLAKYNPFRSVASIFNADGESTVVVTTSNGKATIVGEGQALPESDDESKEIRFSSYKIGSLAKLKLAFKKKMLPVPKTKTIKVLTTVYKEFIPKIQGVTMLLLITDWKTIDAPPIANPAIIIAIMVVALRLS